MQEKSLLKASTNLSKAFRLNPKEIQALKKLGILTIADLLWHFPSRYDTNLSSTQIRDLTKGIHTNVYGTISKLKTSKTWKTKIAIASGTLSDGTGSIEVVWFNQPYIAKMTPEGTLVKISGTVSQRKNKGGEEKARLYFSNPEITPIEKAPIAVGDSLFGDSEASILPIYPESKGVSSLWIRHTIKKVLKAGIHKEIEDVLPESLREKLSLPSVSTALMWIHSPKKQKDFEVARKRFSFEEIFLIQLKNIFERKEIQSFGAPTITDAKDFIEKFEKTLPFKMTASQLRAISAIANDFKKGVPMLRLLNGDVGSGKTLVAAATLYAILKEERAFKEKMQAAYMAPTEILATQQFESLIKHLGEFGFSIGLLTGKGARKYPSKVNPEGFTTISPRQLLTWAEKGQIDLLIGTHALFQKRVKFKNLGYAIIDEQHRFGTNERKKLVRKDNAMPHFLSMTATPIPRTLALTLYGGLDLSLLDEMPLGRKKIETSVVAPNKREDIYEFVKKELEAGRQAYIICPRINEPDPNKEKALNAKSVIEESKRLKKEIFKKFSIGILHSKMTPSEKENSMKDFLNKKTDILVATSVVEVGVNVPNATIIIIEGAERFGLAQLHQLRGRVGRDKHQSYCFAFAEGKSDKTIERLKAFKDAKNGFELAELDLKLRGAGDLGGEKQWGISDLAMEAIKNIKLVEIAQEEAKALAEKGKENLSLELRTAIEEKEIIHLE